MRTGGSVTLRQNCSFILWPNPFCMAEGNWKPGLPGACNLKMPNSVLKKENLRVLLYKLYMDLKKNHLLNKL